MDSSGIALLLRGRREAQQHGVAYRIRGARGIVREVLELTGVWAHLAEQPASGAAGGDGGSPDQTPHTSGGSA